MARENSDWITLKEAAEILGVHPSTVRNWSDHGSLPVYRTGGGHRRYKRPEIEMWASAAREGTTIGPVSAMQAAVGQIRVQIAEGHLEQQGWYKKLDSEARLQYRHGGMALVNGLMVCLASDDETQTSSEAHSIGYEYASRARRYNLSVVEAAQAYLFFRNTLLDAIMKVYQDANIPSGMAWGGLLKKVNGFTDQVLLSLLETFHAFEEAHQ